MEIPDSYVKLLKGKGPTVFSVVATDGSVQSSLVWSEFDEGVISIPMSRSAPKLKRLVRTQKATILKVDPASEDNYISIRCSVVRVETAGAIEHLNKLTHRHLGVDKWFGDVVAENPAQEKEEVVVYLKPEKIYYT